MSKPVPPRDALRQMLALLEGERQALAAMDLERILNCAEGKSGLCSRIEGHANDNLDEECRGLLNAVSRLNETNRKLRNLIAANVESRITALTGRVQLYHDARRQLRREVPRKA